MIRDFPALMNLANTVAKKGLLGDEALRLLKYPRESQVSLSVRRKLMAPQHVCEIWDTLFFLPEAMVCGFGLYIGKGNKSYEENLLDSRRRLRSLGVPGNHVALADGEGCLEFVMYSAAPDSDGRLWYVDVDYGIIDVRPLCATFEDFLFIAASTHQMLDDQKDRNEEIIPAIRAVWDISDEEAETWKWILTPR